MLCPKSTTVVPIPVFEIFKAVSWLTGSVHYRKLYRTDIFTTACHFSTAQINWPVG